MRSRSRILKEPSEPEAVVFSTELEPMMAQGASFSVGTVDPDGAPRVTRAWSASEVGPDRIRLAVTADDPVVLANLEGGLVAVTAANVTTFRAVQFKGRVELVESPDEQDLALLGLHTESMIDAIHRTDGNPIELLHRFLPHEVVMVEVLVSEAFDQTPGPDAGAPLTGGG